MDVTKRRRSRRTHTEDFKQALVAACGEPGFVPVQLPQKTDPVIRLELRKGASSVKVEWPEGSAALCATWLREWLG
jgi:transposase